MARLPCGPGNWHVMSSNGPSTRALDFYSTCYSTVHGKETIRSDKVPRHRGTGYEANFRPTVYYSKQVDMIDNPAISQLLKDNYSTVTKGYFMPYAALKGNEQLPARVHLGSSGFSTSSLPSDQTHRDGNRSLSTESRSNYSKKPFTQELLPSACAAKEESGFTHASRTTSVIPNEGLLVPTERDNSAPQHMKQNAPMEALPSVRPSDCGTGFVRGQAHDSKVQPRASEKIGYVNMHPITLSRTQKKDPAEYSSIVAPDQYLSLTHYSQDRARFARPSEPQVLNRIEVGRITRTGFTENSVPTADLRGNGPAELLTAYRAAHGGVTAREVCFSGPSVCPAVPAGFTKSTRVHQFGPPLNTATVLRKQNAYVARSIRRRDPCFDDHTHDKKLHC